MSSDTKTIQQTVNYFKVLGVRVHAVQIPDVIRLMEKWIEENQKGHYVAVTNVHGIIEAWKSPSFRKILNSASLNVPDGMPLVWIGRRKGYFLKQRVCGPDLMEAFCKETGSKYRHFFYGGEPKVVTQLTKILDSKYRIQIAGVFSPPFRPLTREEDEEVVKFINEAKPDVLWVGLGCPKQEKWMYEHRERLNIPVMVGVGAAFDFLSGIKPRAPHWMQENGLEWLFRLITEPKRLWKRYLLNGPLFILLYIAESLGLINYDSEDK